jgi:hypothetical protein
MAKYNAKLTQETCSLLCEALEKGHSIEGACASAKISRQTFHNWYNKGKNAKSGKFKQFVCDVDHARDKATMRVEEIILDSIPDNPKDAKWWLTKRRPDIYGDRTFTETKVEADVKSEVTGSLFDRVKEKRRELNDLRSNQK